MEIIHLILGKANPERMNGVNRVVNEMATVQVNNNYAVQVWGITADPVHNYPARNFTTVLFKAYKNPFKVDSNLKKEFLKRKNEIVVHIHGAFLPVFYSVSKFLSKHNIPFIITPHSSYNKVMMQKNAFVKKVYFSLFEKKLLDRCNSIHLLGKSEWEGLETIYNNKKSVMLPYGFTRIKNAGNTENKYEKFSVVYCGRISMYSKGLDILIKGFTHFHNCYPDSQLVIIGDGAEMPELKKLVCENGIEDAVLFKGSLFGDEKVVELKRSHVFAHPSRTDGIPATIIEAASLGLPCIVSDATNTGDYISAYKAGYSMEELNKTIFSFTLRKMYYEIIEDKQDEQLKRNAYKMIDEVFNWQSILKKFDNIYTNALAKSIMLK